MGVSTSRRLDFERELALDAQYVRAQAEAEKKMEAEYVGTYLGSSMLTKGTTGFGVIQKPIREKYFEYRKTNKGGPDVGIRINPRGVVLMFHTDSQHGQPNDDFYDIHSIHFIEAVHFVHTKHKDKKFYGAFVPIDDAPDANAEKLFVQIDKKNMKLTQMPHPPLLACVMRRPTGVKAVDCHVIVMPHIEDALQAADMVHRFQERPLHPDYFDRPPPDRREPDVIPRPGIPPGDPRGDYRGDPRGDPRDRNDSYEIYRGRSVELKQEHFMGGPPRPSDLRYEEPNHSFDRDRSGPSSNRSFENERGPPPRGMYDRSPLDDSREFRRPPGPGRPDDRDIEIRRSREIITPNGAYIERDTMGREYEFDNRIVHERQRSTGERSNERFDMGYGGVSPRNEYPPNRPAEYGARHNRSGENFPGPGSRSPEQSRWHGYRGPPNGEPRDYNEPPYPRPHPSDGRRSPPINAPRGRSPPRGHSPPRGPSSPRGRSPEHDEIYSASNLESRIEESHGKPVAKVPPNRHAGVRVLPSLPILGAKQHLKPVSPRATEAPTKVEDKPPAYNFNAKADSDEDVNPYDNAPDQRGFRQNRAYSDRSPAVEHRHAPSRSDRVKSEEYSYGRDNSAPTKPWSYDDEKEKFLQSRNQTGPGSGPYKSKSAHELSKEPAFGQERGGQHMKDLEIADMFSNLRTGNAQRGDVDFERSLGYLP